MVNPSSGASGDFAAPKPTAASTATHMKATYQRRRKASRPSRYRKFAIARRPPDQRFRSADHDRAGGRPSRGSTHPNRWCSRLHPERGARSPAHGIPARLAWSPCSRRYEGRRGPRLYLGVAAAMAFGVYMFVTVLLIAGRHGRGRRRLAAARDGAADPPDRRRQAQPDRRVDGPGDPRGVPADHRHAARAAADRREATPAPTPTCAGWSPTTSTARSSLSPLPLWPVGLLVDGVWAGALRRSPVVLPLIVQARGHRGHAGRPCCSCPPRRPARRAGRGAEGDPGRRHRRARRRTAPHRAGPARRRAGQAGGAVHADRTRQAGLRP